MEQKSEASEKASPSDEPGGHAQLVGRLLAIFEKEPHDWTLSEYTLMAAQLPEPAREAAIYLMWEAERFGFKDLSQYYRMRVASRIDWASLVNPTVRSSWRARLMGRKFAAELQSQKDQLLGSDRSA